MEQFKLFAAINKKLLEAEEKKAAEQPEEEVEEQPVETESDSGAESEEAEDIGTLVQKMGFEKESKDMVSFGKTHKMTVLTSKASLGGLKLIYQYVINPKTGSWVLSACLDGQTAEDMVEFHKGEDPKSLIDSLKKKERITPEQAVNNLNPPADPKAK